MLEKDDKEIVKQEWAAGVDSRENRTPVTSEEPDKPKPDTSTP